MWLTTSHSHDQVLRWSTYCMHHVVTCVSSIHGKVAVVVTVLVVYLTTTYAAVPGNTYFSLQQAYHNFISCSLMWKIERELRNMKETRPFFRWDKLMLLCKCLTTLYAILSNDGNMHVNRKKEKIRKGQLWWPILIRKISKILIQLIHQIGIQGCAKKDGRRKGAQLNLGKNPQYRNFRHCPTWSWRATHTRRNTRI